MGRNGDWLSYAVVFLVSYLVLFVVVPFLAALAMHKGFEKFKFPEVTFRQCVQACFYASSATIVIAFITSFVVHSPGDRSDTQWLFALVYVGVQLLLVPLLMRKRSGKALLIEVGSILLASLFGYAVLSLLFSGSARG